jgi:uncharacterized membrane protein
MTTEQRNEILFIISLMRNIGHIIVDKGIIYL